MLIDFFLFDTEYLEVFLAERRQQEEIYHLFFVLREFAFGHIDIQNLFLGIFYRFSRAISLLRSSCFSSFSIGESVFRLLRLH